jgi:hypothetical protein
MGSRPPPSPEEAAAAERILARLLGDPNLVLEQPPNGLDAQDAIRVWHEGRWVYPRFQFTEDGRLRDGVVELKEVLPRDVDDGNRDAALWLYAPDDAFDAQTPADVFAWSSDRVVAVARARRFGAPECD